MAAYGKNLSHLRAIHISVCRRSRARDRVALPFPRAG